MASRRDVRPLTSPYGRGRAVAMALDHRAEQRDLRRFEVGVAEVKADEVSAARGERIDLRLRSAKTLGRRLARRGERDGIAPRLAWIRALLDWPGRAGRAPPHPHRHKPQPPVSGR